MTAQGSPRTRSARAINSRSELLAEIALGELEHVQLEAPPGVAEPPGQCYVRQMRRHVRALPEAGPRSARSRARRSSKVARRSRSIGISNRSKSSSSVERLGRRLPSWCSESACWVIPSAWLASTSDVLCRPRSGGGCLLRRTLAPRRCSSGYAKSSMRRDGELRAELARKPTLRR